MERVYTFSNPIAVILHQYAGRRREGDLQWQVEDMQHGKELTVITLSVDIAQDRLRGDLTKERNIQKFEGEVYKKESTSIRGGTPV